MINYDEVYNTIINTIIKDFKKPSEILKPNSRFKEDLGLDSLDKIDLLCAVENKYDCDDIFDQYKKSNPELAKLCEIEFYATKTLQEFTLCLMKVINKTEIK